MVKIIKRRVFALSVLGTVKHLDYLNALYTTNRGFGYVKILYIYQNKSVKIN
jgi:hypothetical protein